MCVRLKTGRMNYTLCDNLYQIPLVRHQSRLLRAPAGLVPARARRPDLEGVDFLRVHVHSARSCPVRVRCQEQSFFFLSAFSFDHSVYNTLSQILSPLLKKKWEAKNTPPFSSFFELQEKIICTTDEDNKWQSGSGGWDFVTLGDQQEHRHLCVVCIQRLTAASSPRLY